MKSLFLETKQNTARLHYGKALVPALTRAHQVLGLAGPTVTLRAAQPEAQFLGSLAKSEARGEASVCKKPRTSLTSESTESGTHSGHCFPSSLSDTEEMEMD